MSALTRTEEAALHAAAETLRDIAPRFAEVIAQAADALRPYAWASGALLVAEEDDAYERQSAESGAGWLLDMLATLRNLLDDADDVLREPRDHMVAWGQAGRDE